MVFLLEDGLSLSALRGTEMPLSVHTDSKTSRDNEMSAGETNACVRVS